MRNLQVFCGFVLVLLLLITGMSVEDAVDPLSGEARTYSLSGKGWVAFRFAGESPDLPFIRHFVENMEHYEEAKEFGDWEVHHLKVGYHDLNDDGAPEMLLWIDISGFFCGNSHCPLYIFQFQDGQWKEILDTYQNGVWVSGEKVQGWHTLYSSGSGHFLRWEDGSGYGSFCTETPPAEIRLRNKIVCPTG